MFITNMKQAVISLILIHFFSLSKTYVLDGDVRLTSGVVEVYHNGDWRGVCDDSWDINDATVVCKQLGYTNADSATLSNSYSSSSFWLDDVSCTGTESRISNCAHSGWGSHNCGSSEGAGVVCFNQIEDVRLVNGNSSSGIVEVYHKGVWRGVCDDSWDINDATVVCRQLCYTDAISATLSNSYSSSSFWLDEVRCTGTESNISSCPHNEWGIEDCGSSEAAGVVCSGIYSAPKANVSYKFESDSSCAGTITLTWTVIINDRNATNYTVYMNNTSIATTIPTVIAGMNSYTAPVIQLVGFYANYSVIATRCAFATRRNEHLVIFTPPTPNVPTPASLSISHAYESDFSCIGNITLTWPAVISDRNIIIYEVLRYESHFASITPKSGMNTLVIQNIELQTSDYTVRSINCVGSYMSNKVIFIPSIPNTPIVAVQPTIVSFTTDTCTAETIFILQQQINAKKIERYRFISTNNIEIFSPNDNNLYIFFYTLALNVIDTIFIAAENCAGNSSRVATIISPISSISSVDILNPVICVSSGELTFNLTFESIHILAINYTVHVISHYVNTSADVESVYTGVKNAGTTSSERIILSHLVSEDYNYLTNHISAVRMYIIVNSQCNQPIAISSSIVDVEFASPATTLTIASTSASTSAITTGDVATPIATIATIEEKTLTTTANLTINTAANKFGNNFSDSLHLLIPLILFFVLFLISLVIIVLFVIVFCFFKIKQFKTNTSGAPANQISNRVAQSLPMQKYKTINSYEFEDQNNYTEIGKENIDIQYEVSNFNLK